MYVSETLQLVTSANYIIETITIVITMTVNAVAELLKVDIHVQLINIPVSFSA